MASKLSERQESMAEANMGCFALASGIAAFPFVLGATFFLWIGLGEAYSQVRLNTHAVPVPARVIESEVVRSTTTSGSMRNRNSTTTYWPRVRFAYEFAGASREGTRVWPVEESLSDRASVEAVVARYPPSAEATALVDPADPDQAFLERRWSAMPYVAALLAVSVLSMIAGGAVWFLGWKWPRALGVIGVACGVVSVSAVAWMVWVWLSQVPASARPGWIVAAVGAAGAVSLLPAAALFPARRGAKHYREALAATQDPGDRP